MPPPDNESRPAALPSGSPEDRNRGEHTTLHGLVDWTADAIEALQVGDVERAQRDLNAIHYGLMALRRAGR